MPTFGPISRVALVRALRKAGFDGPEPGGKHQSMRRAGLTVPIPNPHQGDIGRHLLAKVLRRAGISRDEWENL